MHLFLILFALLCAPFLIAHGSSTEIDLSSYNVKFNDGLAVSVSQEKAVKFRNHLTFELGGIENEGYAFRLEQPSEANNIIIALDQAILPNTSVLIYLTDDDHNIIVSMISDDTVFELPQPKAARFLLISKIAPDNNVVTSRLEGNLTLVNTKSAEIEAYNGLIWSLGASFGGDKVSPNPGGDNYNAGSGGYVTIGYQRHFDVSYPAWVGKASLGYRYQGGEGTNEGIVGHAVTGYSWNNYFLGAGVYVDAMNSIEDPDGTTTKFNDAIGSQLVGQWRYNNKALLGIRYVLIDYDSDTTSYRGDQILVEVAFELK